MTRRSGVPFLAAITILAAIASGSTCLAQDTSGVGIAPFYQNVTIGQNQAQAEYAVNLTNDSAVSQSFTLSTMNFGALNNTGGVAFLGSSSSQFAQKHGLTSWMSLNEDSVTLTPGANTQIVVTIHNSASLGVGGHYGAVLATAQSAPAAPGAKPQVGVRQVLSSLILLIKSGAPPPNLVLVSQKTPDAGFSLPASTTDSFENQGDIHVVPRGLTDVRDPTGRLVMNGGLNIDSGIILPGMYRSYSTPLMKLASAWLPGNYTLTTTYRYDGTNATKTFVSTIWYWGPAYVWALMAMVLLVLGGGILWWLGRRKG